MSKYKTPFSVDYRKPVVVDSNDPRYKNLEKYRSRLGRDVLSVDIAEDIELEKKSGPRNGRFWLSIFEREYDSLTTGGIIGLIGKRDDLIVLSRDESSPAKGSIIRYSNNKTILEKNMHDLSSSSLSMSPSGFIKGNGSNLFCFGNLSTATQSGYFMSISSDGSTVSFAKKIYEPTPYAVSINAAAIDSDGNYYIAGTHPDIAVDQSIWGSTTAGFVCKISSDGQTILWQKRIRDGSFRSEDTSVFGVHVYGNNVYVLAGLDWPTDTRRKIYCYLFDKSTGAPISQSIINGPNYTEFAHASTMDKDGNIIIANRLPGFYVGLYKFNSALVHQWTRVITPSTTPQGHRLSTDSDGNIILISEQFPISTSDSDSPNLYKFKANGDFMFSRRFSTSSGDLRMERGIAFDTNDNIFLGGIVGDGKALPIIAYIPKDGSLTGSYVIDLLYNSFDAGISYYETTSTVTNSSSSFDVILWNQVDDDDLVLDSISPSISTPPYSESGVFLS